jgi:type VI secretion system secreted protein VgrG
MGGSSGNPSQGSRTADSSRAARVMDMTTPLGEDVLLFHTLAGSETMSRLFEYEIGALAVRNDLDPDQLLGKTITLKLELPQGEPRCFNAHVTRFGMVGLVGRYYHYHLSARPWLWLLTRASDCRIFQNLTVPEIIKEIFAKYPAANFELRLTDSYRSWDYCVQYRETDFNFVSRLMEQEGIYYYFEHEDSRHKLVLADSDTAHSPCAGYEKLPYIPADTAPRLGQEYVRDWSFAREIQPGAFVLEEFDFTKPGVDLKVERKQTRGHELSQFEFFDYPGEYEQRDDGEHYVRARLEELQCRHHLCRGTTNARGPGVGHVFKLTGQGRQDQNQEYLLVSSEYALEYSEYEAMEGPGATFSCRFSAMPTSEPFRPARTTRKPFVQGPQTAIVVGPSGDEIYTDPYGRVKVQFHWDRYGKKNENSSCWVRVSHPWAGKNWGMVAIPRIGQEVIVDFLEGDPDRPIITGRVYNADQMPPYELPANKTQTGAKSRSSLGGSGANFNEIRFEDKKGSEQLYIHAEKNQDNIVENDETTDVGHDRTENVHNNETITIGVDRTETVGNNETIAIGVNRTETVGANETITIGANRVISVGASETATVALQRTHAVGVNETIAIGAAQEVGIGAFQAIAVGAYQTLNVGAHQNINVGASQATAVGANQSVDVASNRSVSVGGGLSTNVGKDETRGVTGGRSANIGKDDALKVGKNYVLDAGDSITIKTGSASITMKKDGTIVIKGKDISVQGSGKINVKASSDVVIKGSKVGIN